MNKKFSLKLYLGLLISTILLFNLSFSPYAISISSKPDDTKIDVYKIDEYINSEINSSHIPGLVLGIVKGDDVYMKGYGKADVKGRLNTPSTPFIIGSLSKSFTALAIMQLKDEGKIDLDAPVQKYLPWFTVKNENEASKITVRNLLNQTSGFSLYSGSTQFAAVNKTLDALVKDQKNIKLTKPVGEAFQYSNSNFILLGKIIEEVSGISYGEYLNKNIFIPLKMQNSFVSQEDSVKNNMAQGFSPWFGLPFASNIENAEGNVPAGYLISCAEDMVHYLKAQINDGLYDNTSIVLPKSMMEMHTPSELAPNYGMGWRTEPNKIWHDGLVPNFRSYMRIDPEKKIGFFFSFNTSQTLLEHISIENSELYRIARGVSNILNNEAPPAKGSGPLITNIVRIVMFLTIASIIVSLIRLLRFTKLIKYHQTKVFNFSILTLLLDFILPILILGLFPKITDSPWVSLLLYIPDLSRILLLFCGVHLVIGFIKIVVLINIHIKRKHNATL